MFQQTEHDSSKLKALEVLQEAIDYLPILPEKALSILDDNLILLNYVDENQKAKWYITRINASINASDQDSLKASLLAASEFEQSDYYQNNKHKVLNGAGIWLRRSGFLLQAKIAYQCNLKFVNNDSLKVTSLLNLAIVERNLGNLDSALALNHQALELSKALEMDRYIAVINNNLGVFSLVSKDYEKAAEYFSTALNMNTKLLRHSGEVLSGINLLYTFLNQDKPIMFDRLYGRVNFMLETYPNNTRNAYLSVITLAHKYKQGELTLAESQRLIIKQYNKIEDQGIKKLLIPLMAQMEIVVPKLPSLNADQYKDELKHLLSSCDTPNI